MTGRARQLSFAIVVLNLACSTPAVTRAHLGHLSLRAERYLKLDVRNDYVRTVMSLQLEGSESFRAREHVDTDHDGTMTASEVRHALDQWRVQLRRELAFTIDGRPAGARWEEGVIVPLGAVRTTSTTIELVTRVALPPGPRARIELRDALTFAGLQSTELRLEANDGMRFERAGVAPTTGVTPRATLVEVSPNARPRTIVVVARRASAASSGSTGEWSPLGSFVMFFALVLAATVLTAGMMVRRRRAKRPIK